jgi:hypothetical protein
LIKEPIFLEENDINDLKTMFTSQAKKEVIKEDGKEYIFIKKGKFGKRFTPEIENLPITEFNSFYESLFYANFSHSKEPLLICGPFGYKTFLAKIISRNSNVINLYPETSLSQLLGSTHIRDNFNAKKYYLKEILSICNSEGSYKDM